GSGTSTNELDSLRKRTQGRLAELEKAREVLQSRQREARLFAADPPGYYRPLKAVTLDDVVRSSPKLKIAIVTMFGAFLGAAFAMCAMLFAEIRDRRIKTIGDLQRVTGLPVLATLGDLDRMNP